MKVECSFYLFLFVREHRLIPGEPTVCLWLPFSWPGYINPRLLVFSAGIPSSRLGPVAMAIARTHLESVTTAIGPLMSCLMSTALLSSFKVGVRSFNHKFGFSHAWVR